jgi:sporulation protein YlmC with PRC-barrel domain
VEPSCCAIAPFADPADGGWEFTPVPARQQTTQTDQQRTSRPVTSTSTTREASTEELKLDPEEAHKELTDINKASKVMGMKVRNRQNEDVGTIKDLAVDVPSGRIAYAVLSVGGFLGMGDKLIAVPIDALTPQQGEEGFLIDADKDRLAQAPGFSERNWPSLDQVEETTVGLTPTGRTEQRSGSQPRVIRIQPEPQAESIPSPRSSREVQPRTNQPRSDQQRTDPPRAGSGDSSQQR